VNALRGAPACCCRLDAKQKSAVWIPPAPLQVNPYIHRCRGSTVHPEACDLSSNGLQIESSRASTNYLFKNSTKAARKTVSETSRLVR
jgi:hypothetical protein